MLSDLSKKFLTLVDKNRFLFLLLAVVFFVRLPSLFEPFWYGDEAIYAVIGQKILHGGLMYVDIFDHKTPGIYYLTALALKIFGQTIWSLRFVLMVWVLATLVAFFALAKKLFDERAAKVAAIALAALTATPLLEGNIFNSEILMILPVSIGFLFGLNKKYFWSGFFLSFGLLLKFPSIFDFGAFAVFLALASTRKTLFANIKNLIVLTIGYLLPVLISIIFFAVKGALGAYLFAALLFNFSYTNYGNKLALGPLTIPNGLILLKAIPLLALVIYFFWKLYLHLIKGKEAKNPVTSIELVILWLAFGFYGAVFGGRPYPHYLIQATPALALLIGAGWTQTKFKKLALGVGGLVVIFTLALGFKPYIRPDYYPNFFRYFANSIPQENYLNSFDAKTSRNYDVAAFLVGCQEFAQQTTCQKSRTSSQDNIYLWGNSPVIYFLSQRDPTSKYITAFHVAGNTAFKKEVITSIKERRPAYILVEESSPNFPELDNLLSKQYNLFAQTDDIKIYQRPRGPQAD